jgi:hypothetical protein
MTTEHHGGEYILYVGHDSRDGSRFCRGSQHALAALDAAPDALSRDVNVQTVERLHEKVGRLPEWLTGTPTLVCKQTRKAYRGTRAVDMLEALVTGGGARGEPDAERDDRRDATGSEDGRLVGMSARVSQESNFEADPNEDMSKYTNSSKVTESDLQRAIARRRAAASAA